MNGRFVSDALQTNNATLVDPRGWTKLDAKTGSNAIYLVDMVAADPKLDTAGRIGVLFVATLSREPTAGETEKLVRYVDGSNDSKRALAGVYWCCSNMPNSSSITDRQQPSRPWFCRVLHANPKEQSDGRSTESRWQARLGQGREQPNQQQQGVGTTTNRKPAGRACTSGHRKASRAGRNPPRRAGGRTSNKNRGRQPVGEVHLRADARGSLNDFFLSFPSSAWGCSPEAPLRGVFL